MLVVNCQVAPGDVVELSGIFLPIPYTGFRAMRAGLVADTYLEAMSVTHFKKKYEEYVSFWILIDNDWHHFFTPRQLLILLWLA